MSFLVTRASNLISLTRENLDNYPQTYNECIVTSPRLIRKWISIFFLELLSDVKCISNRQGLLLQILNKLDRMKTKESWILMEIQETLKGFKKIEDKMAMVVSRSYVLDKYRLHIEVV